MTFRSIAHEQGSTQWLHWRHNGIGASDAPALLGENPWKRPERLFMEKTSPPRTGYARSGPAPAATADLFASARPVTIGSNLSAMARGNALEPQARALYCRHTGTDMQPLCLESTARPWQRASLDGINLASRRLVEIKCGDKVYAHTAETGAVPGYYTGQLQHILAVTDFEAIDFWVWLPGLTPLLLTVPRDEPYIARMTAAEAAFWSRVEAARG